ncbi:MAG: DUF1611 domain-containing protein [Myxococcales bacterium]|nr:DUF1611 domain-containing protein [Myxococcales bacterium]
MADLKTEQRAIVYCEGAFNTPTGKTAHGLVRFTNRYEVLAVLDTRYVGGDAGEILDRKHKDIPVLGSLKDALALAQERGKSPTHFVIGLAPDGGRLPEEAREVVAEAIQAGLHVNSGLHDFLSDDPRLVALAQEHGVKIHDVRKPPTRDKLHFFSGKIEEVKALKVAVLGTDSAVGKRTTAWLLQQGLAKAGYKAEMIGTGQTAWMQGAQYSLILDSLINDFVAGEIEHAVWSAWNDRKPDVILIEGQGSLMNPAYPGGFEILAAGRPDVVVMQHAPARKEYDGFPGYKLHPLGQQIQTLEMLSGRPVVAVTVNHEDLKHDEIPLICQAIEQIVGLPTADVLVQGADRIVSVLIEHLQARNNEAA